MDDAERRKTIRNFTFDGGRRGNQGFKTILLQLFGYVGHGKSSFINSAICVWSNSVYKNYAGAGDNDGSRTTERLSYPLTENIILVDNRGCSKLTTIETGEIFAQLGNLLPLDQAVRWSEGFKLADRIVEAESYMKASDFIIPIFVYSVKTSTTPEVKEELKAIYKIATKLTTVVPMVILTHKNFQNYTEIENMFRDIGAEKIFALENYTDKSPKRKIETDKDVIQILYEVIRYAEFRANYPRDADQEMIDRKLFVLKYIHDREMLTQKRTLESQREVDKGRIEKTFKLRMEEMGNKLQESKELHTERMKKMQEEFDIQMIQEQRKHEERIRQLKNIKKKDKKDKKNKRK